MQTDVQNTKPLIGLFSEPNFLALNILENLLSKKCFVRIFTSDIKLWQSRTFHLSNTDNFEIVSEEKKSEFYLNLSYAIFISGFVNKKESYKEITRFSKYIFPKNLKKIILFPFEKFTSDQNFRIKLDDNLAIVYLGDILGPRIDLESNLLLPTLLREVQMESEFRINMGETFYPLFGPDVAKLITKWLFSFGPFGHETFLLGQETSGESFFKELSKYSPKAKLVYNIDDGLPRSMPRGFEVKRLPCNLTFALSETIGWIYRISQMGSTLRGYSNRIRVKRKLSPKLKHWILYSTSTIVFLVSPFLILAISLGFLGLGYRNFIGSGGNESKIADVKNSVLIARSIAVIGKKESAFLRYIPLFGRVYNESFFLGAFLERLTGTAGGAIPLIQDSTDLFNKVVGQEVYDPSVYVGKMSPELDSVYQNISFMEAETVSQAGSGGFFAKKVLEKIDFERIKQLAQEGKTILANLPTDLGEGTGKTYLVLFQNNMELRPTGGFIGSFGLITFNGGRMTDFSVSDVYSADGQLKGHVEPPAPIKKYLGEANWWLRDSNWDPNFSTSAKRAEWFLGKEVGENVDGVVGIDLEVVKNLLNITGPVFLSDYNLDITSGNLYEKTQAEAEENFFPGSTRKASFLTGLSRNLLAEVEKLSSSQKVQALKSFFADLDERHIQVFLHNDSTQNALSSLGWGGEVLTPSCDGNCYSDFVGVVEANVGVNKANYFITRSEVLNLSVSTGNIKRTLTLSLTNSANPVLSDAGRYKAYVRILVPPGSKTDPVLVVYGQSNEKIAPEVYDLGNRREIGVPIEVFAGQTKQIVFSWEDSTTLDTVNPGEYRLYVRKQAGVGSAPFGINLTFQGGTIKVPAGFSLTGTGGYVYNTNLARDLFSRISW